MRTEEHRRTRLGARFQQAHHMQPLTRIKAVKGFVEQQHRRLMHQRGRELGTLAHPLAEASYSAIGHGVQFKGGQRTLCRLLGIAKPQQHRTRLDKRARRQHAGERFPLRHQRYAAKNRGTPQRGFAVHAYRSTRRRQQSSRHLQHGALPRAVRSQQPGNPRGNGTGHVVHRHHITVPMRHPVKHQRRRRRHHHRRAHTRTRRTRQ